MTILFRQGTSDAFQQQFPDRRDATAKDEAFRVEGKLKGNQSLGQVTAKSLNNVLCKSVTPAAASKITGTCESWNDPPTPMPSLREGDSSRFFA